VEFKSGIDENVSKEIIKGYPNLTYNGCNINLIGPVVEAHISVPMGKEKYYADLLKKDPDIEDAGLYLKG